MGGKRIHLSVIDSTNLHTNRLLSQSVMEPWTVVSADHQTEGRGQRGRGWDSTPGENLQFSVLIYPDIPIHDQFLISASAALSIVDVLQKHGISSEIKWPNDVLVKGEKIGGLLIENQIQNEMVVQSIVGVGLNVNQAMFDVYRWPATSMRLEADQHFDREEILGELLEGFQNRLHNLDVGALMAALNRVLYMRGEEVEFNVKGISFRGVLQQVQADGSLTIVKDGKERSFTNGEIQLRHTSD